MDIMNNSWKYVSGMNGSLPWILSNPSSWIGLVVLCFHSEIPQDDGDDVRDEGHHDDEEVEHPDCCREKDLGVDSR